MQNQNPNHAQRRKLTPEQVERLRQLRRQREMRRKLKLVGLIAVGLLAIIAIVLLVTKPGKEAPAAMSINDSNELSFEDSALATEVAPTATPTPAPTAEPTVNPSLLDSEGRFDYEQAYIAALNGQTVGDKVAADLSVVDPNKLARWPEATSGQLPLLRKAKTEDKIIAITVDDCFQADNLERILQLAIDYGGKLTFFPIGKNLERDEVARLIKLAWQNGMEIENHTYNHVGMFHYDTARMEQEMWYQKMRLNKVLDVDYQQHFFRPRGGDEKNDQRVHAYAYQMGMYGIAHWDYIGSNSTPEGLNNNLAPGAIYLFHTTDTDLKNLESFIPYAVSQGYQLVTLNEMFGLPENDTASITEVVEPPKLQPFMVEPLQLKKRVFSSAAAIVQKRFIELGWLEGDADGEFGDKSYMATGFFQLDAGVKANGVADLETQRILFSSDAPKGSKERIEELKKQIGK